MGRHFGFENELVGGVPDTLAILYEAGIVPDSHLHGYHCSCHQCDPFHGSLIHAQSDCTVSGELVTKAVEHGGEEAERIFTELPAALLRARARVNTQAGFHVHVDRRDLNDVQHRDVYRIYMRYQDDLAALAAAQFPAVRDYNVKLSEYHIPPGFWNVAAPPEMDRDWGRPAPVLRNSKSNWLWSTNYDTFEFRLWNATTAEWRMRLAVGMSVAIVDAAVAGVTATQNDPRPLTEVVGEFMTDDTWAGYLRQSHFQGGVSAAA